MTHQPTCLEFNGTASGRSRGSERQDDCGTRDAGALAVVAHDLRGPLANLSLLIEAIEAGAQDASADRRLVLTGRAMRLVERLQALLTGLILRVQRDGDPLEMQPKDIDLVPLVQAAVTQNEALATARGIRLMVHQAERLELSADPELLHQVLDNLLTNALKHTRRGGRVTCEARAEGGWIVVRVIDEGPGLTDHDLARAFRPFTRLSAVSDTRAGSTGLGLWIVRLIAQSHGGRIETANRPGNCGAVFTLRLPATATDIDPRRTTHVDLASL